MAEELETSENSRTSIPKKRRQRLRPLPSKQVENLDQTSTIKLLDTHLQVQKECRICLQPSQNRENRLVSPCRCTGSVKYVHDLCFRKWIQKLYSQKNKLDRINFLNDGIQCELCRMKFSIEYNYKNIYCQSSYFYRQYYQSTLVFYLYIAFFLIDLACLGFLLAFVINRSVNLQKSLAISLIIIIGFIFLTVTGTIVGYYFVYDYIVESVWELLGYRERYVENRGKKNRVIPLDANIT